MNLRAHFKRQLTASEKGGFTIVELLIVIVVIGILAAIVLNTFVGAQDKARVAKAQEDIAVLVRQIKTARVTSNKTLMQITGSGWTAGNCYYRNTGYNMATAPKSDTCWTDYYAALNAISAVTGTNLDELKKGDPWSAPYYIDENDDGTSACSADYISVMNNPINTVSLFRSNAPYNAIQPLNC